MVPASLGMLESQENQVKGVDVGVKHTDLVVLHAVLHPLGQKQCLRARNRGLASALVHRVSHLGIKDSVITPWERGDINT